MKWWTYGSTGRSVVLLHAFPCDHTLWNVQAEALAQAGFHVQVPDLPGFGESPLAVVDPSLAHVVHELRRHVDGPTVVVGLSVGGYLAMEWLRQAPEQVEALALVDTKASADTDEGRANRERLAGLVESEPDQCSRILRASMLSTLVSPHNLHRDHVTKELDRWFHAASATTVAWYQRAMAARPDSFDVLADFPGRALVMWGAEDALSPESDQVTMINVLTDVKAVEIPACGHLSALEQPEATATALVDFLQD